MSILTRLMAAVTDPQFLLARDLMAVSLADCEVTDEEMEAITEICHLENIDKTQLLISLQNDYAHHEVAIPESKTDKEEYLRQLILLIGADKVCAPQEIYIFQVIASKMGLNQMDVIGLFLTTATHQYFQGDVSAKVFSTFLKNYIDPIGKREEENRRGIQQMYETIAFSTQMLNDKETDISYLRKVFERAEELLLKNRILANEFSRMGSSFDRILQEEMHHVLESYLDVGQHRVDVGE